MFLHQCCQKFVHLQKFMVILQKIISLDMMFRLQVLLVINKQRYLVKLVLKQEW